MYSKPFKIALPGEEVLQRPGLVLFLTDNTISFLLLHLSNAGGECVDVIEHSLHGDGHFIGLLTKGQTPVRIELEGWFEMSRMQPQHKDGGKPVETA